MKELDASEELILMHLEGLSESLQKEIDLDGPAPRPVLLNNKTLYML